MSFPLHQSGLAHFKHSAVPWTMEAVPWTIEAVPWTMEAASQQHDPWQSYRDQWARHVQHLRDRKCRKCQKQWFEYGWQCWHQEDGDEAPSPGSTQVQAEGIAHYTTDVERVWLDARRRMMNEQGQWAGTRVDGTPLNRAGESEAQAFWQTRLKQAQENQFIKEMINLYAEADQARPRSSSPLGRVTDEEDMMPMAICRVYNLAGEEMILKYDTAMAVGWALYCAKCKWEKGEDGPHNGVLINGLQHVRRLRGSANDTQLS